MTDHNVVNHIEDEGVSESTNTNENESREALQYRLATERNRLRWAHQNEFENLQIDENDEERDILRRRNSIYQAVKMSKIVLNLQETLHRGKNHDTEKAIEYLNEISQQLFTPTSLLYAPYVVRSVYSLCIYKYSEEVRKAARKCYRKFSPCFGVNVLLGETFESTFQAQVRKFWETQDHISNDITKYNWKVFEMKKTSDFDNGNIEVIGDTDENDIKMVCEEIDVDKKETDDKALIKKELHIEVKGEVLDENVIVKKELSFEVDEPVDDKSLVKKELTAFEGEGSSTTGNFLLEGGIQIKQEKPDSDVEDVNMDDATNDVDDSRIPPEEEIKLPELRIKLEPIDLEKLNAEYDSEEDCYILGL